MPITKGAIKRAKQNLVRRGRNSHFKSRMKSLIKLFKTTLKTSAEEAAKLWPEVMKAIDTAAKKFLIHHNNASNKKSKLQKMLTAALSGKGMSAPAEKKAAPAKKTAAKPAKKK